jgi:hypothetical protein
MKLLTATNETQGHRTNDFMWCAEGEIVKFGTECDGEEVDGQCGCRRSLVGVECNKATTTMKVIQTEKTKEELANALRDNYKEAGWYDLMGAESAEEHIVEEVKELIQITARFPIGCVVEKRGNKLQLRIKPEGR